MSKLQGTSEGKRMSNAGNKYLRKLKRKDLLTIMYRQQQQIEELEQKNSALEEQLNRRELMIEDLGSIAEASLQLNGIFEAAQKAADQYIENARIRAEAITSGKDNE